MVRMMMKILFTLSRVSELARLLLRHQAPAATEDEIYGNPSSSGSKRASSRAATDDFEVMMMRSETASSTRPSVAPSQASSISGEDLVTDQILRMVGPPLQCDYAEATKLYVCRKEGENYKRPAGLGTTLPDILVVPGPTLSGSSLPAQRGRDAGPDHVKSDHSRV